VILRDVLSFKWSFLYCDIKVFLLFLIDFLLFLFQDVLSSPRVGSGKLERLRYSNWSEAKGWSIRHCHHSVIEVIWCGHSVHIATKSDLISLMRILAQRFRRLSRI
jgi:hypothetical protein